MLNMIDTLSWAKTITLLSVMVTPISRLSVIPCCTSTIDDLRRQHMYFLAFLPHLDESVFHHGMGKKINKHEADV